MDITTQCVQYDVQRPPLRSKHCANLQSLQELSLNQTTCHNVQALWQIPRQQWARAGQTRTSSSACLWKKQQLDAAQQPCVQVVACYLSETGHLQQQPQQLQARLEQQPQQLEASLEQQPQQLEARLEQQPLVLQWRLL